MTRARVSVLILGVTLGCAVSPATLDPAEPSQAGCKPLPSLTHAALPTPSGSADATANASSRAETAARIAALRTRLDAESARVFAFWKMHGPDPKYGGFYGGLDRAGQKSTPTDKGLIQQARHLWTMSMWFEKKSPTPAVKALADGLYHFLIAHFYDAHDQEFYFRVSESGAVVEKKKVLYAESFAIYALSEYARVFGVPEAGKYALDCFHAIDARAHDAKHGGYDQTNDPAWLTPDAQKEMNTHIHLLESLTSLYEYSKDAVVKQRANELLDVCADKLLQPEGYQYQEFRRDWSPFGRAEVSYGHDLETSWLMVESATVLGRATDAKILNAATAMGAHAAEWGFDPKNGGYFESGPPGAAPDQLEKIWWVQAEALPGLWRLYERTKNLAYLDRLEATLTWIEKSQSDPEYGEWYWGIAPDGKIGPRGDHKSEEWKASYHTLRALVFTEEWLPR
jgi:cellobiose epimerase